MTSLLALHGFTGSPKSWDFLGHRQALPMIVPALVGHVGSEAGSRIVDFEGEVDRLAALIPVSHTVHAVGYSLGARLALAMALRHPERVSKLTLLSGHPGLTSASERTARRAADAAWCDLLVSRGLRAFVDAWQAQPLWASQAALEAPVLREKRAERLSHSAPGLARSLRVTGLAEMPDYGARLSEIRVPVTLVAGQLDHKFSALARLMAERLARARLVLVTDAGHDLLLECPELIVEVIERGAPA
jgi:2-succinyl-6-hydroxy-2,4-cyclohexadiene-1-carboxylate synthase